MKIQSPDNHPNELTTVALKQIVSGLIAQWQPFAVKQRSFILNDVPGDFHLKIDVTALTMVISAIFNSMISRTSNSCIRISIKQFNDIILLRLKASNPSGYRCSQPDWHKINRLAAKIGGCIIENDSTKKKSVTLSFYGLAVAA